MTKFGEASEKAIQESIMQYLRLKGYYCQRMNSGMINTMRANGSHGRVRLSPPGTPDIMAFKAKKIELGFATVTDLLFIEVKKPGKKPTSLQEFKMRELEEYGARCVVAHGVEELEGVV